ncbi:corrinoid methyltransferase [Neiella marina]|uniref:Corrinoid methyltransferase n=1 Tax=Neiella marina TaxID=508461 RepID=A0A8J2XRN3_9GAMM|nr:corrinoid protein [Neiella marina]GGA87538.1 corrinoid methyltransferase [Neiella marina]
MNELLAQLAHCIEFGKVNKDAPYPPDMKGQDGADELTQQLLEAGHSASDILSQALIIGMEKIGVKFRDGQVFVPQVLMSAKAMEAAMNHLKPLFAEEGSVRKGTFIIGTVEGDLHDIGKNLVAMMVEGNGYEVIDMGVDVSADAFIAEMQKHPGAAVGLSALLTTTMENMKNIVAKIKQVEPDRQICIGGAPVNQEFCDQIGADSYNPDPQGVVEYLNRLAS